MTTIVVIGTGYIGLPAALMWAKSGAEVVGVDIDENVVKTINDRTLLVNERELDALFADPEVRRNLRATHDVPEADVFVIAVPTPVDPLRKVADLSHVDAAIRSIAPVLRAGNLVIVESTIPPRTCRDVIKPLIEELTSMRVPEDVKVAHCPERILPGDIFTEIVRNERLIGGMDDESTARATEIYGLFVKGTLHPTSAVVAELAKLMENAYRDINIAIANEFAAICEYVGADADEVIPLANHHPRVNILRPGIGVGGHCIPVDPWFLREVAPYDSSLITAARLLNDGVPLKMAHRIQEAVQDVAEPKIVLLGATYKRDCEDTRESPALQIYSLLQNDSCDVHVFDPLVEDLRYESLSAVAQDAHLLVVLVAHREITDELAADATRIRSVMARPEILVLDR
ncbi:nucleotide sugar dehydrogenase [Nostocoides sp. F2B08]|uniref:nucleotide sugar dehydrogenase n=1 Tax=Nostocoides sp. F2B08 TaxID=2653936 RepID=UPI00186AE8CB|nr:nucleotide sugar dehydrogenase [Tetrasphaera sp. F2B08]